MTDPQELRDLKQRRAVFGLGFAIRSAYALALPAYTRRALSDPEMWLLIERATEGEQGGRDAALVWTLLGCGLRREELVGLRLQVLAAAERRLHVRALKSKSVHSRDVTVPIER
jgi:site-specific recombinase XerD